MTILFNIYKRVKKALGLLVVTVATIFTLSSCSKQELDIRQDFPFEVTVMPVPSLIAEGQSVEIRVDIQPEGNFTDTEYYIRYFQFEGSGILRYQEDVPYLPNDLYGLSHQQFRLYYTSTSSVAQSFTIWISDNFGNEQELTFEFRSSTSRNTRY